jgi:hypothetical protein
MVAKFAETVQWRLFTRSSMVIALGLSSRASRDGAGLALLAAGGLARLVDTGPAQRLHLARALGRRQRGRAFLPRPGQPLLLEFAGAVLCGNAQLRADPRRARPWRTPWPRRCGDTARRTCCAPAGFCGAVRATRLRPTRRSGAAPSRGSAGTWTRSASRAACSFLIHSPSTRRCVGKSQRAPQRAPHRDIHSHFKAPTYSPL